MKNIVYKQLNTIQDSKIKNLDSELPKPPFRVVMLGATGSGKTNMIKNFILNNIYKYKTYFDEIYIFCGSKDDAKEYKDYATKERMQNVHVEGIYNDSIIAKYVSSIEASQEYLRKRKKELRRILFIFDDQIANNISNVHTLTEVDRIFIQGRHINISLIISTQVYTKLNQNIRSLNASQVIVFAGTNDVDLKKIAEEHCGVYDKKTFLAILKKNIKVQYSHVIIDKNKGLLDMNWKNIVMPKPQGQEDYFV